MVLLTVLDEKNHTNNSAAVGQNNTGTTFSAHNTTDKFDHLTGKIQIRKGQTICANDIYQLLIYKIHKKTIT